MDLNKLFDEANIGKDHTSSLCLKIAPKVQSIRDDIIRKYWQFADGISEIEPLIAEVNKIIDFINTNCDKPIDYIVMKH